jgi:hypothetical protein
MRIYWCKPVEMNHFKGTAPAVEFLLSTLETQKELMGMVKNLEGYNNQLAAEIYNQMIKNHEQALEIHDKVISVAGWDTSRETNLTAFLAGIKHVLNAKGKIDMGDIAKTYEDVSYQYHMSGLDIKSNMFTGKPISEKIGVTTELVPMGWSDRIKEVGASIRQNIKDGLKMARTLYAKIGREIIPPQQEELDMRRKENVGLLDEMYENYQGKRILTDEQKLNLEGVAPTKPGTKTAKLFFKPSNLEKKTEARKR